jgi:heptosyltransferase-2
MLIHSPNWLGDVIMALPAFRAWRDRHADEPVHILAKRRVAAIWGFVRDVDSVIVLEDGRDGARAAREAIRAAKCDGAILLPQSFRSAWIVWRAGVGNIRGTAGQFRSFMVSDTVSLDGLEEAHQQIEYARILGVEDAELPPPCAAIDISRLPFPDGAGDVSKALVILPGAARGGSKRWPSANFAEVAVKALEAGLMDRVIVCGTPGEAEECAAVTDGGSMHFPDAVLNLCGKTKLPELAGLLSRCRAVCCNDSGGMHLATAVGAPVIAVFGLTDPAKTGPLGRSAVVAAEGVKVSRSIPRESEAAIRALASVSPERVFDALRRIAD